MASTWESVIELNKWEEFCTFVNSNIHTINTPYSIYNLTPLQSAIYHGRPRFVKYLVQRGATTNVSDIHGRTPVYWAAFRAAFMGYTDTLRVLAELKVDMNTPAKDGTTPLHVSACLGNISIVKYLVEKCHVRINTKASYGTTPISDANSRGYTAIAMYLEQQLVMRQQAVKMVMEDGVVPFCTDVRKIIVKYLHFNGIK